MHAPFISLKRPLAESPLGEITTLGERMATPVADSCGEEPVQARCMQYLHGNEAAEKAGVEGMATKAFKTADGDGGVTNAAPGLRRRRAERSDAPIEYALELLKQFRESGKLARQEASFSIDVGDVSVWYHKGHKPLKGIVVNGQASFTTFSKFRDFVSSQREIAGRAADGPCELDRPVAGYTSGADGECYWSHEVASIGCLSQEVNELHGSCVRRGQMRTPSPCSVAALLPAQHGEGSPSAATWHSSDAQDSSSRSELLDASAALLFLARHC